MHKTILTNKEKNKIKLYFLIYITTILCKIFLVVYTLLLNYKTIEFRSVL